MGGGSSVSVASALKVAEQCPQRTCPSATRNSAELTRKTVPHSLQVVNMLSQPRIRSAVPSRPVVRSVRAVPMAGMRPRLQRTVRQGYRSMRCGSPVPRSVAVWGASWTSGPERILATITRSLQSGRQRACRASAVRCRHFSAHCHGWPARLAGRYPRPCNCLHRGRARQSPGFPSRSRSPAPVCRPVACGRAS